MKKLSLAALAALLCMFCSPGKRVAGGYDDVENPALQVSLLDTLGKPYGPGSLRVYARYQNPVKDSEPQISWDLPAGIPITIIDSVILGAMAWAVAGGAPWPDKDTAEFNLLATAPQGEDFLGGFLMVRDTGSAYRFMRRVGRTIVHADERGILEARPVLSTPVLGQRGNIGARGLELGLHSVFIPGSPYHAKVNGDGSFTLDRLAKGKYEVKAMSQDNKVYSAADSLSAGTEYLPSDWSEADLIWVEGP